VPWNDPIVPPTLRAVVDYCISKNAYKPFRGATVGHFAAKLASDTFITSQRKTNFNDLEKIGLVRIKTDGPDTVLAYGAKPSVGGQSQRIVFSEHPEYDCIVHFHCPIKPGSQVPTVSQREYECGSHQCGQNTSNGLKEFGHGTFSAVYLDQHGPNIVFNSQIDPQVIIRFIEENFDLSAKTGGYVS
jgi:sorbitol-specific phosphotransferase system component IIA